MKPGVLACKKYFNKNREALYAKSRARRAAMSHEERNAPNREHRRANYEKYRNRELRKYGMTHQDYEMMLAAQDHCCRLCSTPAPDDGVLCVDHDHETGKVRALLCRRCNKALGGFRDDPQLLVNAARYLQLGGRFALFQPAFTFGAQDA
jgi:hypothetical protein